MSGQWCHWSSAPLCWHQGHRAGGEQAQTIPHSNSPSFWPLPASGVLSMISQPSVDFHAVNLPNFLSNLQHPQSHLCWPLGLVASMREWMGDTLSPFKPLPMSSRTDVTGGHNSSDSNFPMELLCAGIRYMSSFYLDMVKPWKSQQRFITFSSYFVI